MKILLSFLNERIVNTIITIATSISLIIAVVMMVVSSKQSDRINEVLENVQTRSIDGFPKNIQFINGILEEAIDEANEGKFVEIMICVDMPGYGCYSSPPLFKKMDAHVKDIIYLSKKDNVTFHFWYYCEETRRHFLKEQFENIDFTDWKNSKLYKSYCKSLSDSISYEFKTIDSINVLIDYFIAEDNSIISKYEKLSENDSNSKFYLKEVEKEFPFFCWIFNNKAIISFPEYNTLTGEHSMLTYDNELITFIEKRIGFANNED